MSLADRVRAIPRPLLVEDLLSSTREAVLRFHPARRAFMRSMRTMNIDIDDLARPLEPLAKNDVIVCGSPRSGTSLLCGMLWQPPRMVAVTEPWDAMRLAPADLFRSLRREITTTRALTRGTLDVGALLAKGVVNRVEESRSSTPVVVVDDFTLFVKWPSFHRYAPLLPQTKFLVCVRHPFEVISSFKKQGGSLKKGLDYPTAFHASMNARLKGETWRHSLRRVRLFDVVHEEILAISALPNVHIVRYERWFSEADAARDELSRFLGIPIAKGPASLRPPKPELLLSDDERDLIRRACTTAARLGYSLTD